MKAWKQTVVECGWMEQGEVRQMLVTSQVAPGEGLQYLRDTDRIRKIRKEK
jgi:hypothetical protein